MLKPPDVHQSVHHEQEIETRRTGVSLFQIATLMGNSP